MYSVLTDAGLEFLVLKGFTQWPLFARNPKYRAQYDIDLLFAREDVLRAQAVALQLGYEPANIDRIVPVDHLPTLILKTGWEWKGDYYDPEAPFSLELHFRCWDPETEHFGPKDIEKGFRERAEPRHYEGLTFRALHPKDSVLYGALHMIRHLLRGDLRASHVYEMGWFLQQTAREDCFWDEWRRTHDQDCRDIQAICFEMARRWFRPALHRTAEDGIDSLPEEIKRWLAKYTFSPLAAMFRPNKDEVWLHWSLVKSRRQRLSMLKRRVFPTQLPGPVAGLHAKPEGQNWKQWLRRNSLYALFLIRRVHYHVRAVLPTLASAIHWFAGPSFRKWLQSRGQES